MPDNAAQNSWLTELGRKELELIKELGYDHPDVLDAQNRFRDAYKAVKGIRNSYEQPAAERTNG